MSNDSENMTGQSPAVKKLAELGLTIDDTIPYRMDSMFPKLEGWGVKGEIRNKVKLIRNVEPLLLDILKPKEEVLYIAKGVQYSLLEAQLIGALWANMINQTVFIATNLRLILIQSDGKGRPKHTLWMIYYSQIDKVKAGFTGVLDLRLRDGKKYRFTGFTKLDRKTMQSLFTRAVETFKTRGFDPECSQSREFLCHNCYSAVPKAFYECEECGASFWSPGQLALRSFVFPAWGDILMKHYPLAVFEIIGYLITWVFVVAAMNDAPDLLSGLAMGVTILTGVHAFDSIGTLLIARKGLHPRGSAVAVQSDAGEPAEDEEWQ